MPEGDGQCYNRIACKLRRSRLLRHTVPTSHDTAYLRRISGARRDVVNLARQRKSVDVGFEIKSRAAFERAFSLRRERFVARASLPDACCADRGGAGIRAGDSARRRVSAAESGQHFPKPAFHYQQQSDTVTITPPEFYFHQRSARGIVTRPADRRAAVLPLELPKPRHAVGGADRGARGRRADRGKFNSDLRRQRIVPACGLKR